MCMDLIKVYTCDLHTHTHTDTHTHTHTYTHMHIRNLSFSYVADFLVLPSEAVETA